MEPTYSSRGFKHMEPITLHRGETVRVYESSAAMAPHIWLNIAGGRYNEPNVAHAHLTLEEAETLRDQLSYLIENHYQEV